mgnify:CR=1 FL=1
MSKNRLNSFSFLPNIKDVQISSRHLGLVTAGEIDDIKDKMNYLPITPKIH